MRRTVKRKAAPKKAARKTVRKVRRTRKGAKLWTATEVKMLRKMYKSTSAPDIAKKLKRTVSSVRSKAVALSLKKAAMRRKAAPKRKVAPKRKTAAKKKTVRRKVRRR